jgi:hypothetical protein
MRRLPHPVIKLAIQYTAAMAIVHICQVTQFTGTTDIVPISLVTVGMATMDTANTLSAGRSMEMTGIVRMVLVTPGTETMDAAVIR